jgi:hypothetical protein
MRTYSRLFYGMISLPIKIDTSPSVIYSNKFTRFSNIISKCKCNDDRGNYNANWQSVFLHFNQLIVNPKLQNNAKTQRKSK